MQGRNKWKDFWQTFFVKDSPIPIIISVCVVLFILIHVFDLLVYSEFIEYPLYEKSIQFLSLPTSFHEFLQRPWSFLTFTFTYTNLLRILFECLWLYWIGEMFLNLLKTRQFLTLFVCSIVLTTITYLSFGTLFNPTNFQTSLHGMTPQIVSLVVATWVLNPKAEVYFIIFGRVLFKWVALVYLILQFLFYIPNHLIGLSTILVNIAWGYAFMKLLQNGNDISGWFKREKKSKLKVISGKEHQAFSNNQSNSDAPNQEIIDALLDKISSQGYNSLSTLEKQILFRASQQEEKK